MAIEIERKFLVDESKLEALRALALDNGSRIVQGYIPTQARVTVRARIKGDKAYLTLKGENTGISRLEFEYEIPVADAEQILENLCVSPKVDKTRYEIQHGKHLWELDVFHGDNEGLVVAEVEMRSETEQVELPEWVLQEVTGEAKYYNSSLIKYPYCNW